MVTSSRSLVCQGLRIKLLGEIFRLFGRYVHPHPFTVGWSYLSSRSISARIFHHFYPTLKPSFFCFTCSRVTNNKTRHKTSSYWYKDNKHRLHCTQDGFLQDGLTASSYHLILLCDTWTPTKTTDTVQVFYPCLNLPISLPEDESSSEVPLSGTTGGGIKISPT